MKKRIGDRRRRPRFEIVGTLTGTLEIWQRFRLLNLGAGGALIESTTPLLPGSRVNGRVSICGQLRDVRAVIRRLTPDGGRRHYQVAVEWGNALAESDALLAAEPLPSRRRSLRHSVERRRMIRVTAAQIAGDPVAGVVDGAIGGYQHRWSAVQLSGAVGGGREAQLRMRLGDRSFTGDIEIRREHTRVPKQSGYPLGAVFTAVDERAVSRLMNFWGTRGHSSFDNVARIRR